MPTLSDLVTYCDERTRRSAYKDAPGAFNGLQVANDGRVTKIGAAVDAGLVPFQAAVAAGSARSDLFRIFTAGFCRKSRSSAIIGLLLAPGSLASRISSTTSVIAMVSPAFLRAATMWPGNQPIDIAEFDAEGRGAILAVRGSAARRGRE